MKIVIAIEAPGRLSKEVAIIEVWNIKT